MPKKDLFATVPEFLSAFENILKNGFFEDIQLNVMGKMMEGRIIACFINAEGCVPNEKKYRAAGCGAIIDPVAIVASCRKLASQNKVSTVTSKVETGDWHVWDSEGQNVIGSKGKRTKLSLSITFKS